MIAYTYLKPVFQRSFYRNIVLKNIARLRLSSHILAYETGRYQNIFRDQRKCFLCNFHDLEDEYHNALKCPYYSDVSNLFLPKYCRAGPNMYMYIALEN